MLLITVGDSRKRQDEITTGPWSFFVTNHETHPLYEGVDISTIDGKKGIYMCDAGYRITNSTAQWHIGSDWEDMKN